MRSKLPLEADDARLSYLPLFGWLALVFIGIGIAVGIDQALAGEYVGAVLAVAIFGVSGAMIAYDDATPECEAACANCGAHVCGHSSREGVDEFVEVHASGSPRRVSLGPLSAVMSTNTESLIYCSGECAAADERVLLERDGDQLEPVATSDDHREGEVA